MVVKDCCCVELKDAEGETFEAQAHFDFEVENGHPLIVLHKVVRQDNACEEPVDLMVSLTSLELDDVVSQCVSHVRDVMNENREDVYDIKGDR